MNKPLSTLQLLFILKLFFLCSYLLEGQNPGHFIFDTSNGLVSDEVYDVEIANNGLIWITTDRGVQSYDGFQFTNYSKADGLLDNVNFEIFEDDEGVLWFNGYNGKISYFSDGKFNGYERNDEVLEYILNHSLGWISNIIVNDSSIIMAGEGSDYPHLFKIDEKGNQVLSKIEETEVEGKNFRNFRLKDWIFSFHVKERNSSFHYNKICEIKHDRNIAINYSSLLINFSASSKVINFDSNIGFVNNEDENVIWVCTQTGLYSIDVKNDFKVSQFFKNFQTTSIKRDTEGNYWISTIESGLFLVPSFNFTNLKVTTKGTLNEKVLSFGLLDEYLLAGTSGGSIFSIDSNKQVKLVSRPNTGKVQIERMFDVGENKLNSIVGFLSLKNGKIKLEQSPWQLIYQIYKKDWKLVISTKGLFVFDENLNNLFVSKFFKTPITSKVKTFLIEDDFFLTGAQGGLYLTTGTKFLETEEIYFNRKSIGRVNGIVKDKNGTIVVLTMNNGVFYFNEEKLEKLDGVDDLSLINSGVFHQNLLWVGTNQGLFKYELSYTADMPKLIGKKKYSIADGIPSNYINDLHYLNNELWLATNKGICYFDPNKQDFQPGEVPLFIKHITANDSIHLEENVKLKYDQNDIEIGYQGVSMKKDGIDPFYKFRLIKDQKLTDWKNTNLSEMQFEDLDPGRYTFEVNARNYIGEWNKNSQSFSFNIIPHFTDSLWFKLFSIMLVLGGLVAYFLWVLSRNKQRFLLRERLKQTELDARESELSLLRNQMNPHFIFNSLNSIQNLIFKKDDKKANQYLTTFGSLIRKTLDYTKKKKISLLEEIEFTKKYLELELMRFPQKFEYTIENIENVDANKIKVPPLLIQPIVENAIVHAFKGVDYKGKICIQIVDKNNDYFQIIISDNGLGFVSQEEKSDHKSIGISLIKERLKLINKSLNEDLAGMEVHSKNGTEVILNLPKQL